MLVTIFGGGGFLGRYVAQELLSRGMRVRVAEREPTHALRVKPLGTLGQTQLVHADVRDGSSVARAVAGADAVVNLVAVLKGDLDGINHKGAANVAQAAAQAGVGVDAGGEALGDEGGGEEEDRVLMEADHALLHDHEGQGRGARGHVLADVVDVGAEVAQVGLDQFVVAALAVEVAQEVLAQLLVLADGDGAGEQARGVADVLVRAGEGGDVLGAGQAAGLDGAHPGGVGEAPGVAGEQLAGLGEHVAAAEAALGVVAGREGAVHGEAELLGPELAARVDGLEVEDAGLRVVGADLRDDAVAAPDPRASQAEVEDQREEGAVLGGEALQDDAVAQLVRGAAGQGRALGRGDGDGGEAAAAVEQLDAASVGELGGTGGELEQFARVERPQIGGSIRRYGDVFTHTAGRAAGDKGPATTSNCYVDAGRSIDQVDARFFAGSGAGDVDGREAGGVADASRAQAVVDVTQRARAVERGEAAAHAGGVDRHVAGVEQLGGPREAAAGGGPFTAQLGDAGPQRGGGGPGVDQRLARERGGERGGGAQQRGPV